MQLADVLVSREISLLKKDFLGGALGQKKKHSWNWSRLRPEGLCGCWCLLWVGSKPAYNFYHFSSGGTNYFPPAYSWDQLWDFCSQGGAECNLQQPAGNRVPYWGGVSSFGAAIQPLPITLLCIKAECGSGWKNEH